MSDVTPEGGDPSMGSTIGDDATSDDEVLGPEELDDVTDDGSLGDGTLGDGELADGGDTVHEILANHRTAGLNSPEMDLDQPTDDQRPTDDQGTDNAGRNLGD
jgi:hypothetical protein